VVCTSRRRNEGYAANERARNCSRQKSPTTPSACQTPRKSSAGIDAAAAALATTSAIASQITIASLETLAAVVQSFQHVHCAQEPDPEQSDSNDNGSAIEAEGTACPLTPPPVPSNLSVPLATCMSGNGTSSKRPRKGTSPLRSIRCAGRRCWMPRHQVSADEGATKELVPCTKAWAHAGDELADALFGCPLDALCLVDFHSQPRVCASALPVVLERKRKRKGAPQRSLTPS